jgi:hypothetical protein
MEPLSLQTPPAKTTSSNRIIKHASTVRALKRRNLQDEAISLINCQNQSDVCLCAYHVLQRRRTNDRTSKALSRKKAIDLKNCPFQADKCLCAYHVHQRSSTNNLICKALSQQKQNTQISSKRRLIFKPSDFDNIDGHQHQQLYDSTPIKHNDHDSQEDSNLSDYFSDSSDDNSCDSQDTEVTLQPLSSPSASHSKSTETNTNDLLQKQKRYTNCYEDIRCEAVYSHKELKEFDETFNFSVKKSSEEIYTQCASKLSYDFMGNHTCAICDCDHQSCDISFRPIDATLIQVWEVTRILTFLIYMPF